MKDNGYRTSWFGKDHNVPAFAASQTGPFDEWPIGMGFEYFYGGELTALKVGPLDVEHEVREEEAYLLGMDAYVYGFPLIIMDITKDVMTATNKARE